MTDTLDEINIGAVVTDDYLLDFLILHESLVESWTFHPFALHAFVVEDHVAWRLAAAGIENLEVHRLPGEVGDWRQNAARKIELVEHSGLERCIVTDVDNIFLAETADLSFLLGEHDLVFAGGRGGDRPIQTSLWSFRRSEGSVEFSRRWRERSSDIDPAAWSRLLAELVKEASPGAKIKVLAPASVSQDGPHPSPYGVDADLRPLVLERDWLGVREEHAGRVKVLHLAGLRGGGHRSVRDRIELVIDRFPEMALLLTQYARLANRAAARLGIEPLSRPGDHVRQRLIESGILARRQELPEFLNRRGLDGTGVEVGVKMGAFSEAVLRGWHGRKLISVDPWLEAPPGEYRDVADVSQAEHEHFYERTVARLETFGERSEIWRMASADAAARIEPGSLDFVYLDARHDFESVTEDLDHWFDKIRSGGVFAGHDYLNGVRPQGEFGVKKAVDEFFAARGLPVRSTYADGPFATWMVEIPGLSGPGVRYPAATDADPRPRR